MRLGFRAILLISISLCLCMAMQGTLGCRPDKNGMAAGSSNSKAIPVETVPVIHGQLDVQRSFSGTLEARSSFVVASHVSGRINRLFVDLGDSVKQGQIVAELDSDEYVQAVVQVKADLAVAKASLLEAKTALEVASREFTRTTSLHEKGMVSESRFDSAQSDLITMQARQEVAAAHVIRSEAQVSSATIRLGYTKITADWKDDAGERVVAARYSNEGETISEGQPLLSIVKGDPLIAVFFVGERDYALIRVGQAASIRTDAYPERSFAGQISRIAPIFQEVTRQARIEVSVPNAEHLLKPGMFTRIEIILDHLPEAVYVPREAVTTRGDRFGLFLVNENDRTVSWREVSLGVREGDFIQILDENLVGNVVSLGQHLLEDGSVITLADDREPASPTVTGSDS